MALGSLLSSTDHSVDEVVVGGLLALVVYCGISIGDVVRGKDWSPVSYGGGVVAILGAMAGGVGARNKLSGPAQGGG
jgi:hypothetical protein